MGHDNMEARPRQAREGARHGKQPPDHDSRVKARRELLDLAPAPGPLNGLADSRMLQERDNEAPGSRG